VSADTNPAAERDPAHQTFCGYLTDPAYQWVEQCERRFGTHPVQVVHEWNTAVHAHAQEAEGDPARRAFTLDELQALFDYADEQVARARAAGRKGWLSLFRDATLPKTAYSYGLRRTETAMLDVVDFGASPHAREFGDVGLCRVRFGKAKKGSPPKPRTVLTVWPWTVEILQQWTQEIRPLMAEAGSPALWPSERGQRLTVNALNRRLTEYRRALGFGPGLDSHSLRRSYVTHLIEDGWDPQVWRLVTQTPERLSLPVLAALCDILEVSPAQLIATRGENAAAVKKAASAGDGTVTDLLALRPKRAQLRPEQ